MKHWNSSSSEIAYLFNPAFCGSIIYSTIFAYQKEAKRKIPFPIIYLILSIILHKKTRDKISSRTYMHVWIQNNPEVLIQFAKKTKALVPITNEAIEFLLQNQIIEFIGSDINIVKTISNNKISKISDQEIMDCHAKAAHVGKWFARSGAIENIYVAWGVKP